MIPLMFLIVFLVWLVQRMWRIRRILRSSWTLRNKYVALPIIGHGLMFRGTDEDRMETLQKFSREAVKNKHGMTSIWVGLDYHVMISDAMTAEIISKSRLNKSDAFCNLSRPLLGNGLIAAQVDIWRPRRKVMAPTFSQKNLDRFVDIFANRSMLMINKLKPVVGNGTFSIIKYMTSYTMDSVCETVLGIDIDTHDPSNRSFVEAFHGYCQITSTRFCQGWLQWEPLFKLLPIYTEFENYCKTVHDFVDEIIKNKRLSYAQETKNKITDNNTTENEARIKSFLEQLILSSGGNEGYSNLELREETLVLLLAGTDTSAVGMAFTAVMLSRYMDVQDKAYEEIREVFGDSKRPITFEDLPRLKYIDAVLKETCRLYPPVPMVTRKIDKDLKLPSGLTLVADTSIVTDIMGINRNPHYWGADAEEFRPDRFLSGPLENPSAYMTFSSAPRNCLGYQYAMTSNKVALTTLLRHYRLLPPSDVASDHLKDPLRIAFDVMLKHVDDYKLRLELRT